MILEIEIDKILVHRFEFDPHTTARKSAYSFEISPQIMVTHLREGLGMKYFHLGWIPDLLTFSQKATRLEVVKVMVQQLTIYVNAGFQHLLTGNKSLTVYDDAPSPMRTMARNDVNLIARLTNHPRKTMTKISSALTASPLLIFCRKKPNWTPSTSGRI
jgi:hypothetical protein